MSQNKNLLVLASSILLLAGCSSTIEAKPSYDKDNGYLVSGVLEDGKTEDLTNNLRTAVWDALKSNGSINSAVVDQTIFTLAELELGSYKDLSAEVKAQVNERMDDKLFDAIKTGAYDYRNYFNEKTFVNKIKQSLPYSIDCSEGYTEDYIIFKDSRDHLYEGGSFADGTAYTADPRNNDKFALTCNYQTYKEQTYLPEVYKEMLIEKYITDKEYDTLGRSYARKIQYVGISENTSHPGLAGDLVNAWVDIYLSADSSEADLDVLAKAWIGYSDDSDANEKTAIAALQKAAGIKDNGYDYTLYGDVLSDFAKINENPLLNDASIENSFTNNGAYLPSVGLAIKENELRKRTLGDDGWFVKSTDLTSLPSDLTKRLFDISTANGMNSNLNNVDVPTVVNNSKYVKLINGNYYLLPEKIETSDIAKNYDVIFYDASSSTYYIVLVEEAVNPVKLKKLGDNPSEAELKKVYTEEMRKEAIYEIAKKHATRDNSKNKAMVYYLKESGIIFHDQDIYDYFKTTYPEMFEKED